MHINFTIKIYHFIYIFFSILTNFIIYLKLNMFSQTIRTNKYTATIDIPAEKLYTRSKFIQIPKNNHQSEDQIIVVPNCCRQNCCASTKSSSSSAQMKFMIQQLQKAYNEDMQQKQRKYSQMENLKNQQIRSQINLIAQLKDKANSTESRNKQLEISLNESKKYAESQLHRYKMQILQRKNESQALAQQIRRLKDQNQSILNEKNTLVKTKIRQFQSQKDKIWSDRLNNLQMELRIKIQNEKQLQNSLNQTQARCNKLRQDNARLNQQCKNSQGEYIKIQVSLNEIRQENKSLVNKISDLSKELQVKQNQKHNLNEVLITKIQQNQELLLQLSKQRQVLQRFSVSHTQFNNKKQDLNALQELHREQSSILATKIVDLENILHKRQDQINQKQQKIVLKTAQCLKLKQKIETLETTFENQRRKIEQFEIRINQLIAQNQKLHIQLSKKTLQHNNLLSNPQQKVYSVKIEKTVDRKEYIEQLEVKLAQCTKIIDQLKQDNESYVQQIRKRVMEEDSLKQKSRILQEEIAQLNGYISKKENSLAWVVDRQIAKDVQLSRQSSGISSHESKNQSKEKTRGYKVFVNEESDNKNEFSIIKNLNLKGQGKDGSHILVIKPENKAFNESNVLE